MQQFKQKRVGKKKLILQIYGFKTSFLKSIP